MSKHLGAAKTVELLDGLTKAVREIADREKKLNHEFQVRCATLQRHRDTAVKAVQVKLAEDLAVEEVVQQESRAAAQAKYEARGNKIVRAHRASQSRWQKETEDRTGRLKYELQREMMQAKREQDASLAAEGDTTKAFHATLEQEKAVLAQLESTACRTLAKSSSFLAFTAQEPGPLPDVPEKLAELRAMIESVEADLVKFRKLLLPALFKRPLIPFLLALGPLPLAFLLPRAGITGFTLQHGGMAAGALVVFCILLTVLARKQGAGLTNVIGDKLRTARQLHTDLLTWVEARHREERDRIEREFVEANRQANLRWDKAEAEGVAIAEARRKNINERRVWIAGRNEEFHQLHLECTQRNHDESAARLRDEADRQCAGLAATCEAGVAKLRGDLETGVTELVTDWQARVHPVYQALDAERALAVELFPSWDDARWQNWKPPESFGRAAPFARLEVDAGKLGDGLPIDPRLALPGPAQFTAPVVLRFPEEGSLLLEANAAGRPAMIGALNNLVLRLLATAPPGRLNFTIFDPVGLGQNFSGIMHLADHEERLINGRIWTQSVQFEEKLAELNEHMEKVIQTYLRNEYASIADYNEQAGKIAEAYHVLVVADFPANFSDVAARRLLSVAAAGARCGVHTLIHWDRRLPLPQDFVPDELRKTCVRILCQGEHFLFAGPAFTGIELHLDQPPEATAATELIHQIGRASKDSYRVQVPFEHVAPAEADVWSGDTTDELRVPIGRTGATKLQYLALGRDTRQHALIAGKTGSGKSTLFHVMITNLALWCSPDQVEFYLIDFKKGVEFKCYAAQRLPHARVVAIESDREFGLSVLQRVDEELKRRGDMFRKLGAQNIAGYKQAGGTEPMPRTLLLIDEFQEIFVEDDRISQMASVLLDRIVRQGRAFGIHVVLGSQTLGGAYTVARTTLGQMVIRIALQCDEADAYLIMDDSNPAPRLLSRPGEGIYNDNAGAVQGNSPFQVVWLPDAVRDESLGKVRARANQSTAKYPGPIVFEGNAPADIRENPLLNDCLTAPTLKTGESARVWLGAPNSIKGPTEVVFQRQSGNNLLIVGQHDESALTMIATAMITLSAQFQRGKVQFILLDGSSPGSSESEYLELVTQGLPHEVKLARAGDLAETMSGLVTELNRRSEAADAGELPTVFLLIHGLPKFGKLRYEDDFGYSSSDSGEVKPGAAMNTLLADGSALGIHVIATCDTGNNVNRFFSRKGLSEFGLRVLFQMSANDSSSLIESPKASTLGLHRAIFFNEPLGQLEVFRPYALPGKEWVKQAADQLSRLHGDRQVSS